MPDDADAMEASLIAIADRGVDLRTPLFERFFAALPDQRALFINEEAASRRMTEETLAMLFALARGETWVDGHMASFVDNHRNYGDIAFADYAAFLNMVLETLAEAAGSAWTFEMDAAWTRQANVLKDSIARWSAYDWRAAAHA